MLRSFRLKFFLLVTFAIIFFAIVTRISVRNSSTKPLHEFFYSNFAGFLASTVQDKRTGQNQPTAQAVDLQSSPDLIQLKSSLIHYFPELSATQVHVWFNDANQDAPPFLIDDNLWRALHQASQSTPIQLAEVQAKDQAWVVFKAPVEKRNLLVAIPAHVFQQKFEDILTARESVVNSMWPILLLYIILCTWFLTSWVMRSLQNLQNTFKNIEVKGQVITLSEKQFDVEFGSFIDFFNRLIQRLQLNFEQASRFSSDAAHELRTPLTVIRGNLKRLLNRAPDNSPEQIQLSMLSDEVERLISITNKLVLLSQADGANLKLDLKEINLFNVIAVIGEDVQSLAPHVQFEYSINPEIKVLADFNLFQQLLNNLISNAIKYTPPQGKIKFNAKVAASGVEFNLSNTTYLSLDGLDQRVFQRFYRHLSGSNEALQRPKGDGLGLSLCQEIARAHGSTLSLHTGPGQWVTFTAHWKMPD